MMPRAPESMAAVSTPVLVSAVMRTTPTAGKRSDEVADQVQRRHGADAFVDEDDFGQFVQGLGGEPGEGVQEGRGVRRPGGAGSASGELPRAGW